MAGDSGSSAVLGVVVGAIVVAAIIFFVFVGFPGGEGGRDVNVSVDSPSPAAPSNPAPSAPGGG